MNHLVGMCLNKYYIKDLLNMGYLLIKDVNTNKVRITENDYIYKLSYVHSNIRLMGISFVIKDITIQKTYDKYHIYVKGQSLRYIQDIDRLCKGVIPTYEPVLNTDESGSYLSFKICDKINSLLKDYRTRCELPLTIYKVNKFALKNIPILYILY